jgi:hypothetical protein
MIKLKSILNELISAAEARRDEDAIQTVIDGKRDLGFLTLVGSALPKQQFVNMILNNDLKLLHVPSNPYKAFIYYRKGAEKQAKELRDIAEKYEGYLSVHATEEDSRRIGELLGYKQEDIDWYINKNYR